MEALKKIPAWAKALIMGLIGIVVILVLWKKSWEGYNKEIKDFQAEADKLQQKIVQGKEARRKVAELTAMIEAKRKQLDKLKSILPEDANWGQLARTIESFASDQAVSISSSAPGGPRKHEDGLYIEQAYTYQITGAYHDVAHFFEQISGMERIVNVRNMTLAKASGRKLTAGFQAVTFMQVKEEEAAVGGGNKGRKGNKGGK